MKHILPNVLLEATRLTRGGRLTEATAALQRMFGGQAAPGSAKAQAKRGPPTIDGVIEAAETAEARPAPEAKPAHQEGPMPGAGLGRRLFGIAEGIAQPGMQETLRGFLDQVSHGEIQLPGGRPAPLFPTPVFPTPAPVVVPDGARFLAATFSNHAGSRPYKLYVPSGYRAGMSVPLIVMLHGCTQ
ncbi:MAG TPA: esterase, partial [Acetobacteraceae bacterium]|nr:esterase [Acetobacteraceae bacterium]